MQQMRRDSRGFGGNLLTAFLWEFNVTERWCWRSSSTPQVGWNTRADCLTSWRRHHSSLRVSTPHTTANKGCAARDSEQGGERRAGWCGSRPRQAAPWCSNLQAMLFSWQAFPWRVGLARVLGLHETATQLHVQRVETRQISEFLV